MKNEFVYGNGKVSFYDDKTMKMEQRDYQDNISEVLATENMIEEFENERTTLSVKETKLKNKILDLNNKIATFSQKKMAKISSHLLSILVSNLLIVLFSMGLHDNFSFALFVGVNVSLVLPLVKTISISKKGYIQKLNSCQKKLDGCLQEELSLNNMLTEYKNRLKRLLNDKSTAHEEKMSSEIQTVHYQENLKRQRRYLELMKICGKNKEHFIESYQNETLVGELSEEYPEDEVNIIYGFAEDEAFKLSKQKH